MKRIAPVLAAVSVCFMVGAIFDVVPAAARVADAPRGGPHAIAASCNTRVALGFARCDASLLASAAGMALTTTAPSGYGPSDLRGAYNIASAAASAGGAQTVAIVDAYDDPYAASNLATYRSTFGLPACSSSGGCFRKVNQSGTQSSYPSNNQGWALEISLDLDMVSAACPKCHILLVEAKSNSLGNLFTAENRAASMGATEISNSWGGGESSGEASWDQYFKHTGVAVTASTGDNGYGVSYPAASQFVTAVGGTSLTRSSNTRGWNETVWSGTGSGCSSYEPKPSWQHDTGCSRRTVGDVAAIADPYTGVAVYDTDCSSTNQSNGTCFSGWGIVGGTSAGSPLIAAVYALAGNAGSLTYGSYSYGHTSSLNDITSGRDGSCSHAYLCSGEAGYDGPTGNGSPKGTGAF